MTLAWFEEIMGRSGLWCQYFETNPVGQVITRSRRVALRFMRLMSKIPRSP